MAEIPAPVDSGHGKAYAKKTSSGLLGGWREYLPALPSLYSRAVNTDDDEAMASQQGLISLATIIKRHVHYTSIYQAY